MSTDWDTSPTAAFVDLHQHASPRQLLLIQAEFVRWAEADRVHDEAKRSSDLIELQADDPRPWDVVRAELEARPGYWNLTHIFARDTSDALAREIRRFVSLTGRFDLDHAAATVREVVGNPFRPVVFAPSWRTEAVVAVARTMYELRDFGPMPVLADALDDAGCDHADILAHCRGPGPHVRGCWVVDLVLRKS